VFQCGFFALEAPTLSESPADDKPVVQQIVKNDNSIGRLCGQCGAYLLAAENVQGGDYGYMHDRQPI
jgi:hypothetical protein